jgi:hypothetical protein
MSQFEFEVSYSWKQEAVTRVARTRAPPVTNRRD